MIFVLTDVPLDPAERERGLELVRDVVERSRQEPGVVTYHAAIDSQNPNLVRFHECYEDEAAAEAHTQTEHYREFVTALPEVVAGELKTTQFSLDDAPESMHFEAERAIPDDG